jgi:hypothetical protein
MTTSPATRRPPTSPLPPELRGSVPRDVRLTAGGRTVAALAIVLAAGALVSAILLSLVYTRSVAERQLRAREGRTADAEVVRLEVTRGEQPRRTVMYRYEVDGRPYTGRARQRRDDRGNLESGAAIRIGYLPSRPEASWLIGDQPRSLPFWTIPLAMLSLLLAAAGVARSLWRQWILLSEGRVAAARVIQTTKVHRNHHAAFRVSYEFHTLSGAKQTARFEMGATPPPIGSVIPIVYHRDKPQWSAAYPLQLVRPTRPGW